MASAYVKFQVFVQNLCNGVHNLGSDTLKVLLTNTVPSSGDANVNTSSTPCQITASSNANEIASGNGYTKGGNSLTITSNSESAGLYTLAANQSVWTAAGGTIGPFEFVVLYDNTAGGAAATRPVIAWWDYGSAITLNSGETFTVQFNSANPGTIFTLQ